MSIVSYAFIRTTITTIATTVLCSDNVVLRMLAKYCKDSNFALAAKYHFSPHDVLTSSVTFIKQRFWNYFFLTSVFYVHVHSCVFCYVLFS